MKQAADSQKELDTVLADTNRAVKDIQETERADVLEVRGGAKAPRSPRLRPHPSPLFLASCPARGARSKLASSVVHASNSCDFST